MNWLAKNTQAATAYTGWTDIERKWIVYVQTPAGRGCHDVDGQGNALQQTHSGAYGAQGAGCAGLALDEYNVRRSVERLDGPATSDR